MRIGILTGEYPPMQGGIGAHCDVLSRKLKEHGHDIFVFSGKDAQPQAQISLTKTNGWGALSIYAVNRWAKKNKLDIINLHYQTAAYNMSAMIHFFPQLVRSIPIVTTFHDLRFPYLFPKAGKLRDDIVEHLVEKSKGVIVTNHEDYERVKDHPQSTIIPIGSSILDDNSNDFDRNLWRQRAGAETNDLLVAHFGFINHSKGVDNLIEAMNLLKTQEIPVKLIMVGGRTGTADPTNAAYADTIDKMIDRFGLIQDIIWTGFVTADQVAAYLKAADAVTLPFRDGASYRRSSLMAAIHHESVIVTTKPKVKIPTFQNNINMLLFPTEDSLALADLLRSLYAVPQMGNDLRGGVRFLKKEFDWNTITQKNVEFFQQVIGVKT